MSEDTNDLPRSTHGERTFETFELEGPAALLTPSVAIAALASGLGLSSEDIGGVSPLGSNRLSIELDKRRALRLSTPRDVPARLGHERALFRLGRETDLPDFAPGAAVLELVVTAKRGPIPGPSALAAVLCERLAISAEDLGFALEGHDFIRLSVPLAAARALREPIELSIGESALAIEVASKKA